MQEGDPWHILAPMAVTVAAAPYLGMAADWATHKVTGAVRHGVQAVVRSAMRRAGDVWRMADGKWGAKNQDRQIRYFTDQQKAHAFAQAE